MANITVPKEDFEMMLVCGVRYALTRKTYITSFFIVYIKQYWDELSDARKNIIIDDIKEAIELYNSKEFKVDNASWRECLAWILEKEE